MSYPPEEIQKNVSDNPESDNEKISDFEYQSDGDNGEIRPNFVCGIPV
ncbi:MAG: hypothetical protein WC349_03110 [Patescibacteria group bacterium]|jgi:hypothetical protein